MFFGCKPFCKTCLNL
uniref:Uncharacterized protein n=1 Tax=Arundo donax TaxID=35708 RepID=A0A0A9BPI0_ARUDO